MTFAYSVCHLLWCFCSHTLLMSINDKSYLWNICLSVHLSISQRLRPCRWRCWTCLLRSTRLITASCSYCVISMHHMTSAVRLHLDQLSNASGILDCRQRPYVYKRNRIQIQLQWLKQLLSHSHPIWILCISSHLVSSSFTTLRTVIKIWWIMHSFWGYGWGAK